MQQYSPMAAAVGVELATSTVTVSIQHGDEEPRLRRFEGGTDLESVLGRLRDARDEVGAGPAPVVFAVPSIWDSARRAELVAAAERDGFDRVRAIPIAEAAAIHLADALDRGIEPGESLAVCRLGAATCEAAVVRRGEDGYRLDAVDQVDAVGGDEFEQLLLAYLSGRYRDTDPAFWDRIDAPAGEEDQRLRSQLVAEIRRARELISKRSRAGVPLPGGDRDLHLTRAEVESCIGELVDHSVELVASVLTRSGGEASALVLAGGASRTPLLADRLRERTGLEPVLPADPESSIAEGARLAALAEVPAPAGEGSGRRRGAKRLAVLAAVLVPLVAATAVFGSQLGTGESEDSAAGPTTATVEDESTAESATESESEAESGSGGAEDDGPATQAPSEAEPSEEPTSSEPAQDDGGSGGGDDDREEHATSGSVPNVTELSAQDAASVLEGSGFDDVAFANEREGLFGPYYEECEVIAQDPAPGDEHDFAQTVTITYSYRDTEPSDCEG